MIPQGPGEEQESLRDLAARVIADGTDYLRAELTLVKEETLTRVKEAGPAIVLGLILLMLAQGTIVILAISLGLLLARWLGMPGGFLGAGVLMIMAMLVIALIVVQRIRKIVR